MLFRSVQRHGLQPARLLCPWDFPGENPGVGCHSKMAEIFSNFRPWVWRSWAALPRARQSPGRGGPRRRSRESVGPQCAAVTLTIPESKELNDDWVGVSASSPVEPRVPCWKSSQTSRSTAAPSPMGQRKAFIGASLAVQWLRLLAPSARGPGFDPWSGN